MDKTVNSKKKNIKIRKNSKKKLPDKMEKISIISLVLAIISILTLLVGGESLVFIYIDFILGIILSIVAVILGIISIKDGRKKMSITSIVIGTVVFIMLALALTGFIMMSKAENCVDNKDGTSTCEVFGQDMEIENIFLTEKQYKK